MLRTQATFATATAADVLLFAVNNAKKFAQRKHSFELNRLSATVSVSSTPTGGDLTTAVEYGTSTPVVVKAIERAYLTDPNSGQSYPIPIVSRSYDAYHMQKSIATGNFDTSIPSSQSLNSTDPKLIRQANKLYLSPSPESATTVYLDIVKWMPDYSDTVTEDFFLNECSDYMLYRSIVELNFFLKDDERVVVSQKKLDEVWDSVLAWDNCLIENASQDAAMD